MKAIFITDDHALTRAGLRATIEKDSDLRVCGEASNAREALDRLKFIACDLLILDISMPEKGGLESIQEFRKLKPGMKILIVTMYTDWTYLQSAVRGGADGYVLKHGAVEDIHDSVRRVLKGERVFPEAVRALTDPETAVDRSALERLTPREREVLSYIARARMNREIAASLDVSVRTVESHRASIMEKLETRNSMELMQAALRFFPA